MTKVCNFYLISILLEHSQNYKKVTIIFLESASMKHKPRNDEISLCSSEDLIRYEISCFTKICEYGF